MSDLEWKTPKGTTLYLMLIKGKRYLPVQERVIWFREEKPNWRIKTHLVSTTDNETVAYAEILDETNCVISTAHKFENKQGFADHLEKAETGAIGRALALCGYGTQFCGDDFTEKERLADSPSAVRMPIKKITDINDEYSRELQAALRADMKDIDKRTESENKVKFRVPQGVQTALNPGDYVAKCGREGGPILGHKLKEITKGDLMGMMNFLRTEASHEFVSKPDVQEFIAYTEDYLNELNGKNG